MSPQDISMVENHCENTIIQCYFRCVKCGCWENPLVTRRDRNQFLASCIVSVLWCWSIRTVEYRLCNHSTGEECHWCVCSASRWDDDFVEGLTRSCKRLIRLKRAVHWTERSLDWKIYIDINTKLYINLRKTLKIELINLKTCD